MEMIKTVLENNNFSFGDKKYLQKDGVAIGSRLGKNFACSYMRTWDEKLSELSKTPLFSYCHSAPSIIRPSSVRRKLSHFLLLLWNRWTEFNETWQKARSQRPLPSLCFSSRWEKQDDPGLWLAETFSTSSLKPLNGIQRNLTGSKISTPSTKFVFFGRSEN